MAARAPAMDGMEMDGPRPLPPVADAQEGAGVGRWGASLVVVLAVHAGAAAYLLAHPIAEPVEPPPTAVMIDLAPMPAAPPEPPAETPPTPPQPVAEPPPPEPPPPEPVQEMEPPPPEPPPPEPVIEPPPDPVPPPEPSPAPEPEVAVPPPPPKPVVQHRPKPVETPPPKRVERPRPRTPTPPATAPATPAPPAPVAAAPVNAPPMASASTLTPKWQSLVLAHLQQLKRYPRAAQARRQEGVTTVRMVLDREGRVLSAALVRSSGYSLLDEETLALVERASPLPAPPPEIARDRMELVVPVQYFIR